MLQLAQEPEADRLISQNGFALLVGMVLDQQIPLERAFAAPLELARRLGGGDLDVAQVAAMGPAELTAAFCIRPALHRFPAAMADRVGELSRIVVDRYGGNADSIWASAQDGRELLARVRELPGFGEQKAKIFVALLGKQLGARPTGWRDAAGAFGEEGSRLSIADIADAESLAAVRAHKAAVKAAAKSLAGLEHDAGGGGSGNARAGRGKAGKPAAAAAPSTKSGARTAKAPAARAATSRRA